MHSIRRSLLGYLLLLVAIALGAVGLFVDRFAKQVITAREVAEKRRIDDAFEIRRKEAEKKFDAELLTETKSLAQELQGKLAYLLGLPPERTNPTQASQPAPPPPSPPRPEGQGRTTEPPRPGDGQGRSTDPALRASESDVDQYRLRALLMHTTGDLFGWNTAATCYLIDPPPVVLPKGPPRGARLGSGDASSPPESPRVSPLWSVIDAPRLIPRLQAELRRLFDDDEHPGTFQFDLVDWSPGHPARFLGTVRSARLGHDLRSVDPATISRTNDVEYVYDDVDVPGTGKYRRVLKLSGRPWLGFPVRDTPPSGFGSPVWGAVTGTATVRFASRSDRTDMFLRVYVHHMRPIAELDTRIADENHDQERQLSDVREETRVALADLRTKLWLIGAGSFLALVVGGWVIVARGLAPIGALSVAVSQVSEKDFRLALPAAKLSRELAPIHACLTQTLDLLRLAFAREKQAVADISHELRTPIAGLLATIDVSLRKPRSPDQYRATLEDGRAIAHQLGQLVERIMTLASLDAGTARTAVGRVDAVELAGVCGSIIRGLAEAHNLAFTIRADEPIELDTDPDQLREVLMNLLHNAIEYNRPGGEVELAVYRVGQEAVFEVRDTGIGMPSEVRERIFERFFRADPSRHATGVHAGLGLAIVKEYVDRLGGTISVDSQPDVGTTFRVTLPGLSSEPTPPTEGPLSGPWARGEVAPAGS